ncbi:MAG: RnfABCDGE type electron transport complex subunit C, partial [Clostridiales bacterium]|nr:RnfABCDGE type electron transport complex subunit C [Clostridiales bacterium]
MKHKRKTFPGGAHIIDYKGFTNSLETVEADAPAKVYIPMSMHIGAPSKPLVEVGDEVKMGQKVAESQGYVSVPAHSSVSGTVTAIQRMPIPSGRMVDTVVIENDYKDEWASPPSPVSRETLESMDSAALQAKVLEAGVVGMGGATFPSHVKVAPPQDGKGFDYVILNGIECEPFLTADHRIMLERPERILAGMKYFLRMLDCDRGVIAIEENKMDAFDLMIKLTEKEAKIETVICKEKYPQGSEKQLINTVTGREVPPGGLPSDVGVLVHNVSTAAAVADAIEYGRPLIDRIVTLNGNAISKPMNYRVRIGTLYGDLITQNGGITGDTVKVISGGPMMGTPLTKEQAENTVVTKTTSGFIILKSDNYLNDLSAVPAARMLNRAKSICIQCRFCTDLCPRSMLGHPIEPHKIMRRVAAGACVREMPDDPVLRSALYCCECGVCELFACPMQLQPRRVNAMIKKELSALGVRPEKGAGEYKADQNRDYRKIPSKKAAASAGVLRYYDIKIKRFTEGAPDR